MQVTWLDNNSWILNIGKQNILLDPWLVDSLVFANSPWLFEGKRPQALEIPESIDLILLSQGLEDHAHPPTLKQLDHDIPVVASPNAAKVVQELGYSQITTLEHGESFTFADQVEVKAVPGSPIGPTLKENGYILKDLTTKQSLYYEPHGNHDPEIKNLAPVDVVITPLVSLALPLVGPIIKGQESALQVSKWLQPKFILPTADAKEVSYQGLLVSLLSSQGSLEKFQEMLTKNNLNTKIIQPQPKQVINLNEMLNVK
ncbi:MAG: MBL fold metallo-hydrolase [Spirulinaceae cyanobacterium]